MAINLQIFEDAGALSLGRGTVTQEIDNIGWKNSILDETYEFSEYPIVRPYGTGQYFACSFKKYVFFKISGTYEDAQNWRIYFEGTNNGSPGSEIADNVQIFYKWTNTYATPDANLLNGTLLDFDNLPTWNMRRLATTGPNGTLSDVTDLVDDTTYYTPYLVTQVVAYKSTWDDFGNIDPSIKIKCKIEEHKTGLPEYDSNLVNWTW